MNWLVRDDCYFGHVKNNGHTRARARAHAHKYRLDHPLYSIFPIILGLTVRQQMTFNK